MERRYYSALEKKSRVEVDYEPGFVNIVDFSQKKILFVKLGVPAIYWELPYPETKYIQTGGGSRIGQHTCTIWQSDPEDRPKDPPGYITDMCLTSDRISLWKEFVNNRQIIVTKMVNITFERQDPALFHLPPGAIEGEYADKAAGAIRLPR